MMKEREKLTNWLKKTSFLKLDEKFELSIPFKKARLCKSGFSKPYYKLTVTALTSV